MSAPHVTGVVSLLYSLDPDLTPAQVLQILQNTATRFPAGSTCDTSTCGSGIVNAGRAVREAAEEGANPLFMPIIRIE
jgi:serine protease